MTSVEAARHLPWDRPVTPEALEDMAAAGLPSHGQSPAIDLQRRLGEAALRGFYPAEAQRDGVSLRHLAVMAATALVSWGIVFGAGALLIR